MPQHGLRFITAEGRFDKAAIMRAAWSEIRRPNRLFPDTPAMTKAEALRFVWNIARQEMATAQHIAGRAPTSTVRAEPGEYADTFEQWARDRRAA